MGPEVYIWLIETLMAVGGHFAIVFIGLVTDLAQAPHWLRRLFALATTMNIWLFVFGEWLMLAVIGGIYFSKGIAFNHVSTTAWYKVTIATLLVGGLSLQLMPSIRYWYWDYYYDMLAKKQL